MTRRRKKMDYCNMTEDEIVKSSPLLDRLANDHLSVMNKLHEMYPEDSEDWMFMGDGGDCGNFAIALKRHFCGKGELMGVVTSLPEYRPTVSGAVEDFEHVVLQIGNKVVDKDGVNFPGEMTMSEQHERIAIKWGFNRISSEDLKGGAEFIEFFSKEKQLEYIDPMVITVSANKIFKYLPRTTNKRRIEHLVKLFETVDR